MGEANEVVLGDESEPQDAVPEEYLEPLDSASGEIGQAQRRVSSVGLRVFAYGVAATWPFLGAYYEYKTLNDSGAMSDICNESGCVALGTEFAHDALAWLLPVSLVSVLAVRAGDGALRALRGRLRRHTPKTNPVSRTALVGLFVGICALALLLGVLRGVMINEYGR